MDNPGALGIRRPAPTPLGLVSNFYKGRCSTFQSFSEYSYYLAGRFPKGGATVYSLNLQDASIEKTLNPDRSKLNTGHHRNNTSQIITYINWAALENITLSLLYDSSTGALVRTLRGHGAGVEVVSFSPNGELLVSGSRDRTVRVWDSVTGAVKLTLKGHESDIKAVSFSPDGNLIFSIASDALMQWDSKKGALCGDLKGSFTVGSPMIFSPDGQLLVSVPDKYQPWIWNFGLGSHCIPLAATKLSHGSDYPLVCLSQDGEMIAIGNGHSTEVVSTATGALLQTLDFPDKVGRTCAMSFLPDSQLVALTLPYAFDKSEVFTNLNTGLELWSIPLDLGRYEWRSVSISPDGKLLIVTFTFTSYAYF
ncbi:hypothetical protein TWF751_004696 [Orbilia oligospora]|nr:hypothetical protein TWF751_004696 [Orbilia oligospora]